MPKEGQETIKMQSVYKALDTLIEGANEHSKGFNAQIQLLESINKTLSFFKTLVIIEIIIGLIYGFLVLIGAFR